MSASLSPRNSTPWGADGRKHWRGNLRYTNFKMPFATDVGDRISAGERVIPRLHRNSVQNPIVGCASFTARARARRYLVMSAEPG